MTKEQLDKGNALAKKIEDLQGIIKAAHEMENLSGMSLRNQLGYVMMHAYTVVEIEAIKKSVVQRLERKKVALEVQLHTT